MDSIVARLMFATIQSAVFFGAVWLICLVLRRMPANYKCWLWRSVSVKFILSVAFVISLPVAVRPKRDDAGPVSQVETAVLKAMPKVQPGVAAAGAASIRFGNQSEKIGLAGRKLNITTPSAATALVEDSFNPVVWFAGLWVAGAAIMLTRGLIALQRVRRILGESTFASRLDATEGMTRVLEKSGRHAEVRVRAIEDLAAPALLGLLKPTIVLPADADCTSPEAISSAFAHELAHLSRHDGTWILLAEAVKAVFWFHPCAWIACRMQRIEAEIAADRLARTWTETSPREYAEHLLEWIDPQRHGKISVSAVPGLVPSTHELITRVKAMSLRRYGSRSTAAIGTVLGLPLVVALVPIMLIVVSGSGLANSPWPKFHGGLDNSGRGIGSGAVGKVKWLFPTSDDAGDPSIGPDGTIYIGSGDSNVYALDGSKGTKKWAFKTNLMVTSTPAVAADGTIYVGSQDNKLYALNGKTGVKKWSFSTGGLIYPAATIGLDGTVYVGSWDSNVYALDGTTGAEKWSFKTDGPVTSDPAIGQDGTLYIGSHGQKIYALNAKTGKEIWSFAAEDTVNSPSLGQDGTVYVGSFDGRVYALNGKTGAQIWASQTGNEIDCCPAIGANGAIYVGSEDHRVYALDAKTGKRIWAFATGGPVEASPAIASDGTIYVGSMDQKFYAIDGRTGQQIWSFTGRGGFGSSPAIGGDGTIYVGSNEGTVYALR